MIEVGVPVKTVASGGLPVVEATFGTPVTEVSNNFGLSVTKVVNKPGLPVVFETIGVAPSTPVLTTFATFNGTPSAGVVISNGNLTVVHGTTGNGAGVQSTLTLSTGKYYFEIAVLVSFFAADAMGVKTNLGGTFSDPTGSSPNGVGVGYGPSSRVYSNSVDTGKLLGATAVGDIYCGAIDMTNRLAWYRRNNGNWNGDPAANPATGVGGVTIVAGAMSPFVRFTNQLATSNQTANFGQSAFTFTAPSGFSLGWGT
jgi:hypothetical protein